jgi:hypothetical protein
MSYYGVTGYPTCVFDGTLRSVGGSSGTYDAYIAMYNNRRNVASPLSIEFRTHSYEGNKASVSVTVKLEENLGEGHLCHIVLWEDNLHYGGRDFYFVERATTYEPITIKNKNDVQVIKRAFTLDAGWNKANLGVSAWVQNLMGQTILNGRATMLVEGVGVEATSLGRVKALYN